MANLVFLEAIYYNQECFNPDSSFATGVQVDHVL